MGGERASTTRMRESGRICCSCRVPLEPYGRERDCPECQPLQRIYMHFILVHRGWYCQFLKDDLRTPLRRKLTFSDPQKLLEIAQRGGADSALADKQALERSPGS